MGWFGKKKKKGPGVSDSDSLGDFPKADLEHLTNFARTRVGVEAYVEPATSVTQTTVIFIATSGEWTRRRVAGPRQAYALAQKLTIPVYDAQVVGYPARMRAWTSAQRGKQR